MKNIRIRALVTSVFVLSAMSYFVTSRAQYGSSVEAQAKPTPTPPIAAPLSFDQAAAIAKLREQIKGKEKEPASNVFKNIQMLKTVPAGRLLAIMEMGYARSLGVNCTHCHVPDKWEGEEKTQKQTARDMSAMVGKINGELLKSIKNLKSESPTVNCTTCHRGEVKPALNLPQPKT
jgi:photosynthetic reaction center cytochrome c subunit